MIATARPLVGASPASRARGRDRSPGKDQTGWPRGWAGLVLLVFTLAPQICLGQETATADRDPPKQSQRWLAGLRSRLRRGASGASAARQDAAVTRARANQVPPEPNAPTPSATTPPANANTPDNLAIPRVERGLADTAEPTAEEKAAPSTDPTPMLLNKALGLQDAPVRVFGWLQNSFTGNANGTPRDRSNFSVFPNELANQWMGNQYYLVVENPLESNDTVNFGFRVDTLFGNDWEFTKDYGLFDRAFHNHQFAGIDLPQIYGDVWLPILTRGGVHIKGGRFYSPAGYEGVQAINRPLLSVPYMVNFTPFTFVGMLSELHLTDRINILNGTINGSDRWINATYKWGYLGGITYKFRDDKTNLSLTAMSVPDQLPRFAPANTPIFPVATPPPPFLAGRINPFYGSSFRGYIDLTVTRQWTDKLTQVVETAHVWDPQTLGFGPIAHSIAYHGLGHWFLYNFTDKVTGVWRSEVFWDPYGAATGSASNFYEITLGFQTKPKPWLWFRPEARYDWSQFTHPYSDGTRSSQLTLAFDVIILF
jgi:hypothetical protein